MIRIMTAVFNKLLFCVSFFIVVHAQGPLCYRCEHMPHQRDCSTITQCGTHELCYGQLYLSPDGIPQFRSGCKDSNFCHSVGKRDSHIICDRCCQDNYCNIETCDTKVVLGKRCLSCDDVLDPTQCNLAIQCDQDEVCYTEKYLNANKEERFRLGCVLKTSCMSLTVPIGKRHNVQFSRDLNVNASYCGKCCDSSDNCNRDMCGSKGSGNTMDLIMPPARLQCRDVDSVSCQINIQRDSSRCTGSDLAFKNLLCPWSCGTCSGGGIIHVGVPTVSTTAAPARCQDQYSQSRCHHIDCAIDLCSDPTIAFLCQDYCAGNCGPRSCNDEQYIYNVQG